MDTTNRRIKIKGSERFEASSQHMHERRQRLEFVYSSSQKYSNKHIMNHNFFSLESFCFKFSGNLYIYLDQILSQN
jgi:hypothetical protein